MHIVGCIVQFAVIYAIPWWTDLDLLLNGTTPAVPEQQHTDYMAVASSPTTRSPRETSTTLTTDGTSDILPSFCGR